MRSIRKFIFFFFMISGISNAIACSCAEYRSGIPEYNKNDEIKSSGVGYWINEDKQRRFKFIKCFNRTSCKDLIVPVDENQISETKKHLNENLKNKKNQYPFSPYNTEYIVTYFNSFEEASAYDLKENALRALKEKEKAGDLNRVIRAGDYCRCSPPISRSIISTPFLSNYINERI